MRNTIHEDRQDYKCESCDKLFSQLANLRPTSTEFMKAKRSFEVPHPNNS